MSNVHPIADPAIRAERAVIYCFTCGRSTWTATHIIEGLFGYLPYGLLTGRLHCKKGCGDRFCIILPLDAPTPRQWVEKYGKPLPEPPKAERRIEVLDEYLPGALVEVGDGGTFRKLHARAVDDAILHWGFEYLLDNHKPTMPGDKPPHLIVTRGAQWSRDSRRDYKVIPGKPFRAWPEK